MSQATFTSYSSFFSSGLLAQSGNPRLQRRGTFNSDISEPWDDELSDSYATASPSRPSSPVPLPEDSAMDIDSTDSISSPMRRSATPTPRSHGDSQGQTTPVPGAHATSKSSLSISRSAQQVPSPLPTPTPQQPRLRRRRSSLTQAATSPMNAIRGPARAAENALHLQKQLPAASRSRSGSVGADMMSLYGGMGAATEGTSIVVGRMRSGSCSSVISLPAPASAGVNPPVSRYTNISVTHSRVTGLTTISLNRPRRAVRRVHTTPMPALLAPPPNAPLPALPPTPAGNGPTKLRPANTNLTSAAQASSPSSLLTNGLKSPATYTSARARGLSVSNSALDGAKNRIDEEMKEN
ncbi:hypothetical protein CVT25_009698 [Psilocybe cyanescens]|uniref:Uncharacterized protein n=1 Tax=Psilocybe cyanescens TaxID=93625 RepID=A0A409WWN4_PSICY|nr:hypothetical protein CVT25_009698 [Psilocybe cyanescens]